MNGEINVSIAVNNVPGNIEHGWMILRRTDDGKIWYFGIYAEEEKERAELIAQTIGNGFVVKVE